VGLEGVFIEKDLPLLIRREGIADWCDGVVRILDRRALPHDERHIDCESVEDVARCIENMVIQGAFSLSVAAGYGLALAVSDKAESDCRTQLTIASERLKKTRPTGLAISRMMVACLAAAEHALAEGNSPRDAILATVERGAVALSRQAYEVGRIACEILPDDATILTHCFPDRPYAYMLVEARRIGKPLKVIVSETRPYLQGARLTSLCAMQTGFDVHVITDGMGGFLMRRGEIDAFVTAADRVCMDGTVCNKIGTYQHALAAKTNGLPYYVLRQSGPDIESAGESSVEVEFRDGEEIVNVGGTRIAPSDVKGLYPAFDITPPDLVSKIITDRGAFPASEIASYVDATPFITDAVV
ncbi:MAG: s-methyl-5-thioribose-1-phosphate isomerase, partial [Gammaproteobacteria bacterium]|nr:s-methyl-5-thioribose-1-phosphate isomerase [Gammaproteobacteria bacterium]